MDGSMMEVVLAQLIDQIQRELDQPWRLGDMAQRAGYSPAHLARAFAQVTGCAPASYVRLLRLERAAEQLLYAPERSVLDIALEAGYQSAEAFSRAFKRALGCSPERWRMSRRLPHCSPDDGRWRQRLRELTLPRGLDPHVRLEVVGPWHGVSLIVPDLGPPSFMAALEALLQGWPLAWPEEPWRYGALAQPWGWIGGPIDARELRVVRFLDEAAAPPPRPPFLAWRLEAQLTLCLEFEGSFEQLGAAIGWIMQELIPNIGLRAGFAPTWNQLAQATAAGARARIFAPVRRLSLA